MYGLPADLDLGLFREKTLIQVCIGMHDLILNFDGGVSVSIGSSIGLATTDGAYQKYKNLLESAVGVVALLGRTVMSSTADADGTLSLQFSGGARVDIYDDSKQHESYTIINGDRMFVI